MQNNWIGKLRIMAVEYKYKELDRLLKDQFINDLNDDGIMVEIIRQPTLVVDTS